MSRVRKERAANMDSAEGAGLAGPANPMGYDEKERLE